MTELSKKMYYRAMDAQNVAQAIATLKEYSHFRTMGDVLRSFSGSEDPRLMLVDGLLQVNPEATRASVDKKVRNWLGGKTQTIGKADAFILSRILKLSLDQTDDFLKMVTGEGIHWRDPEDIVWSYAITQELDHAKTMELLERAKTIMEDASPAAENHYTAQVRERLQNVLSLSEDALLAFLERERPALGTFHNTAHQLFTQYMNLLEYAGQEDALADATASEKAELDHKMTSRDILEKYMYRLLVPVAKRGERKDKDPFSAIQRSIRANWPDESTISKMKSRELDVTRKVLILLFLATDGSESDYEELDEDEDILTRDEIFQNICMRLNRMLNACGFQPLDPRNPFDWVILFCICVDDLWIVDMRLAEMLENMFPAGNEKQ